MSSSRKEKNGPDEMRARAYGILVLLKKAYPDAKPLLNYRNPYELLIGTILAAQCTDKRVNQVTPAFFAKWPAPQDILCAAQEDIEGIIRPTGFFRNKARLIKGACFTLSEKYSGRLPDTIEELITLKGVGRKTANVIVGHGYGKPAVVVDTHCLRVSRRLGLTQNTDPVKIECDLRALIPEQEQTIFSDVINWHGRYRCKARKPQCPQCEIDHLCLFPEKTRNENPPPNQ
jgi:endonuclease-3